MALPGHSGRRHPKPNRRRRVVLAAMVFAVGAWLSMASLANIAVRADPKVAHAIAPYDGRIMAAYARQLFLGAADGKATQDAVALAKRALAADATAVKALSILGLAAQLRGDVARATEIHDYSNRLSRRESEPRMSAIENAVNRGDIEEAIRQYDLTLRVSRDARGTLFPILGSAIAEPKVRQRLLAVLLSEPHWREDFLGYLATSGTDPKSASVLMAEGARRGLDVAMGTRAALVNALVAKGEFETAWTHYGSLGRGADRTRSRDPEFSARLDGVTAFDWTTGPEDTGYSTIARGADGGGAEYALPPGRGGIVLRQAQMLAPGDYGISGTISSVKQEAEDRPYWSISCAGGHVLLELPVGPTGEGAKSFSGAFTVPQGCRTQNVDLVAAPVSGFEGAAGQVDRILISRVPE